MTQFKGTFSAFWGRQGCQGKGPKDTEQGRWPRPLTSVSLLRGAVGKAGEVQRLQIKRQTVVGS